MLMQATAKRFLPYYKIQSSGYPAKSIKTCPLSEAFDFHLRVERKMTDESVATIFLLFKAVRLALHRNLSTRPSWVSGQKPKTERFAD